MWTRARCASHALTLVLLACSAAEAPPRVAPARAAERPSTAPPGDTPNAPQAADPAVSPTPGAGDPAAEDDEGVDDGFEEEALAGEARPHPLAGLDDRELERRVLEDPASLGSMSVGRPSGGSLINGVRMPAEGPWRLVSPNEAWGTEETIASLSRAITAVADAFPDTRPLPIGHIGARRGGPLQPHLSHQSGRDVDLGYYYRDDDAWYRRGTPDNLDLPRNWAFVRALVTETDVELILIDRSIQALLRAHAERAGEDRAWIDDLFRGSAGRGPLIRHAKGHATHLHVRFFNPVAQETARRCLPVLVRHGVVAPPVHYVHHRVKQGETLGKLAKRYDTTVREIQRANGLKNTRIQARKTYRIPQKGPAAIPREPVRIPPRRLPPHGPSRAEARSGR
jgi:LysM repeat protein